MELLVTLGDNAVRETALSSAFTRENVTVRSFSPRRHGDYAFKINQAYQSTTEPFIFLGADDLAFHSGWWAAARRYFDDPAIGVVGTNDLSPTQRSVGGEHATHSVVRRTYADRGLITGERGILFEGYAHEYVDDELIGTAKKRQAWAYARDSVVEHLHPHWGKAPMDDLYRRQRQRMTLSRHIFMRRSKLWR